VEDSIPPLIEHPMSSSTERPMPLPIELVLEVITCLLPPLDTTILSPFDDTTKTLLSFTLVCHETRRLASRYLAQHCVYLDSPERLYSLTADTSKTRYYPLITDCLLSPFGDNIDDAPLCASTADLLLSTCHTLRKLVIDVPLRTCYPEDDHGAVRSVLRAGFESLLSLEEFVSVRDELYLDVYEKEHAFVWAKWPKLKRMALWNPDCDETFWRHVAEHPSLNILILSNADSLGDTDPKVAYLAYTSRSLRVVLCAMRTPRWNMNEDEWPTDADWTRHDPEGKMKLIAHAFPRCPGPQTIESCQQLVRIAAQSGTLWNWSGDAITQPASRNLPGNVD
jgi:hypothetical protein